jgi:hypothetical protein
MERPRDYDDLMDAFQCVSSVTTTAPRFQRKGPIYLTKSLRMAVYLLIAARKKT